MPVEHEGLLARLRRGEIVRHRLRCARGWDMLQDLLLDGAHIKIGREKFGSEIWEERVCAE